jgi:hypothetical protein
MGVAKAGISQRLLCSLLQQKSGSRLSLEGKWHGRRIVQPVAWL